MVTRNLGKWLLLLGIAVGLGAGVASAQDLAKGEELYDLCAKCHGPDGAGNELVLAPVIAGMSQWYVERQLTNFRSSLRGLHPDDTGGLRMHPMSLAIRTDEDIVSLAAYVASLPNVPSERSFSDGDAAKGEQLYATCGACHGAQGAGIEQMNAPRLVPSNDWYLLSQLQKYKAGIRGSNPKIWPK